MKAALRREVLPEGNKRWRNAESISGFTRALVAAVSVSGAKTCHQAGRGRRVEPYAARPMPGKASGFGGGYRVDERLPVTDPPMVSYFVLYDFHFRSFFLLSYGVLNALAFRRG